MWKKSILPDPPGHSERSDYQSVRQKQQQDDSSGEACDLEWTTCTRQCRREIMRKEPGISKPTMKLNQQQESMDIFTSLPWSSKVIYNNLKVVVPCFLSTSSQKNRILMIRHNKCIENFAYGTFYSNSPHITVNQRLQYSGMYCGMLAIQDRRERERNIRYHNYCIQQIKLPMHTQSLHEQEELLNIVQAKM